MATTSATVINTQSLVQIGGQGDNVIVRDCLLVAGETTFGSALFSEVVGDIVAVPGAGQHQGGHSIDIDCIEVGPRLYQYLNDREGHRALDRKVKDGGQVLQGASDPDSVIQQPLQFPRIKL